jgi:DNA-binding CsgD family transcriptional regulator
MPYVEAKMRFWQTLAILETTADLDRDTVRAMARKPLLDAYRIGLQLPAVPLLRAIVDLATRARIPLPARDPAVVPISAGRDLVAVGPGSFRLPLAGRGDGRDRVGLPIGGPLADVRRSGGSAGTGSREGPPWAVDGGSQHDGTARELHDGVTDPIARSIHELVIASIDQASSDPYGLSPREREVLNILAEGRTDRDIASRLFISERTVHVHVRRILAKLGVGGRTEAAGLAIRQGLVPALAPPSIRRAGADDVASLS